MKFHQFVTLNLRIPLLCVLPDKGEVYSTALIIGGFCHGMIYVAGMAYVHVRTGAFRVQRIAIIHIVYLCAVAATAHAVHEFHKDNVEPRADGRWEFANKPIAYLLFGTSGLAIVLMLVHFLMHGRLYNSKAIGDAKLSAGNAKCDNFKSTLGMPVIQRIADAPNFCNQIKLMKSTLSSKLTGGLIFNNLIIGVVWYSQRQLFTGEYEEYGFAIHYMALVGLFFGIAASFYIPMKWIFIPGTLLHCILLITALSLYTVELYIGATMFLWLFYIIAGVVYFIPDIILMEAAPLSFYESVLGVGYCFEAVPLLIATYMINQTFPVQPYSAWIAGGIAMAGLIIASIGMIFWYPNTYRRGHIDIQYMLLYPGVVIDGPRGPSSSSPRPTVPAVGPGDGPWMPRPPGGNAPPTVPVPFPIVEKVPMPIQPPVAPTPQVPYPEVQGIQAAATVENVGNGVRKADAPAIIETSVQYKDMSGDTAREI